MDAIHALCLVYAICDVVAVALLLMLLWGNGLGFDSHRLAARYTLALPVAAPLTLALIIAAAIIYLCAIGIPRLWRLSEISMRMS